MRIKGKLLQRLLEKHDMTAAAFARDMGVRMSEIEKMLNGEVVDVYAMRKLIFYIGPREAERIIDWEAIGIKNPLADETNDERTSEDDMEWRL